MDEEVCKVRYRDWEWKKRVGYENDDFMLIKCDDNTHNDHGTNVIFFFFNYYDNIIYVSSIS